MKETIFKAQVYNDSEKTRVKQHKIYLSVTANLKFAVTFLRACYKTRNHLRANVAKNQTFSKYCGNSSKINSAHILMLGRPYKCETNHCIVRLAEYRFIFKKIDINGILSKYRF